MHLNTPLAEFCLNYIQKKGASYAEVRLERTEGTSFLVKNGIVEASGFDKNIGIGMRFLINNSLGFASTNLMEKSNLKNLIDKSIRSATHNQKLREKIKLAKDKSHKKTYEVKQKKKLNDIDPKEKINLLLDADKEVTSLKINAPGRWYSLSDSTTTEYLITSEGTKILATIPRIGFYYFLTINHKNQTFQRFWQYGETQGFEAVKKWNIPQILCNEAKAAQLNLKHGIKAPKGILDLVAGPEVIGIMCHESAGHPYEADRIFGREAAQAGESFISPKMLGKKIGSDIVTVVDDPTQKKGYGYYLFDNEGIKARRKYLIKKGKITEFLHNRQTAALMQTKSNGSSRAVDYGKESIVRMSNTFLLPGDHSYEELIEGVKKGILMKNFMEWNIDDKRLNQKYVGAEAFLIKNGKLADPVKNPVLEITTPKLWSAFDAIGKKIQFSAGSCGKGEPMQPLPVWFGGPYARLKNVRIT